MVPPQVRRRIDDYFFAGMSLVVLGTVFLGFGHNYLVARALHVPPPSALILVHGAVFSVWILLLVAQITLVSAGKVAWHMKLGVLGAFLACLVVVLGVLAIVEATRRGFAPPGLDAGMFLAVDLGEMASFALMIAWGLRVRRDGPAHKRLVILATSVMMYAPVSRWPFVFIRRFPGSISLIVYVFPVSIIVFDLLTRRRVHRVTAWGSLLVLVTVPAMFALGHCGFWLNFTEWVRR
jgi:hypothetical protein